MEIFIGDTYDVMSKQAATDLTQIMRSAKKPLVCTASGDSPVGLYKEINHLVSKKQLDISEWNFISLDEWVGLNGNDEGSCRYHLNNQLFHPLEIPAGHICFFDGRAENLEKECAAAENFILEHDGIDVAILGLGLNGHAGMNEPGTSPALRSHVAALDPITEKTGQKYFKKSQQLSQGITLGLANLMETKHLFLLVSGPHKAEIVQRLVNEEISEQLPASLLRNHPRLKIYLDVEAADLIRS